MSDTAQCPFAGDSFDHHSPDHAANAPEIFRALRETGRAGRSELYGGFHVLTRYDDIYAAARNVPVFSSNRDLDGPGSNVGGLSIPANPSMYVSLDEKDPPDWKRIRSALNPTLSPAAVERLSDRVMEITTYFIDQIIEKGSGDLVLDVANPVPAVVIVDYLGLPLAEWERFADPIHKMVYLLRGHPEYDQVLEGMTWILDQFRVLIAARRAEPTDDMASYLIKHPGDGTPFNDQEILEMLYIIILGGVDTTTSLISNAFHYLSEHPEDRQRMIDDPSLIDPACEEFLRFFSPIQTLARTVNEPVTFAGAEMKHGDRVLLAWASANRDESQFDRPDEVVIDRFPNRHAAFGIGIHRCLGSHLARSQFKTVLQEVLRRLPDYRVDVDESKRYNRIGIVNGWERIPATFTPGEREGNLEAL
jgi:cytochrome P450